MVFSSIQFIFIFLPLTIIGLLLLPEKFRNLWIFVASLAFYYYGSLDHPEYLLLLVFSVLINFIFGRMIAIDRMPKRPLLIAGIVYNLGWLFVFKYAAFVFGLEGLVLPVGISFYTFQAISYLIDVYRDKGLVEKSIFNFGMYLTMFPKLMVGPITKYKDIKGQIFHRQMSLESIDYGLRTFVEGLGLKVLLANQIGGLWNDITAVGYDSISTPVAWMGIFAYSFQLYFDFYGYSLMAIGLGQMMGFKLPDNFDHPYESVTMTEFWRRWHITLGTWFKDYVYIPLGGNRKGEKRTYLNLLIVWLLTGIWHGAGWNFIIWGLLLFAIIALEKKWLKKFMDSHKFIGHIYMALLIPLSWMVFAIDDIGKIGVYISRLIGTSHVPFEIVQGDFMQYLSQYGVLLAICFIMCTSLPRRIFERPKKAPLGALVLLVIFWASVYCLYIGLNDPFMYFRF
ncbi:MAG: MBOAT family protein [Clostridia bacterium]|nr:MBOAT family protein [Clostridia bacterium]